jgi:hypothetical protein
MWVNFDWRCVKCPSAHKCNVSLDNADARYTTRQISTIDVMSLGLANNIHKCDLKWERSIVDG